MPTSVLGALAKDASLQQLIGTDAKSLIAGTGIHQSDIVTAPLFASEAWLGGPFDVAGVTYGVNAGYAVYAASLVTDVAGSILMVHVSQDALTWAPAAVVVNAANVTTTISGGSTIAAGAASIPVASTVGFLAGDTIILDSLANAETLTIAAGGVGAAALTTTTVTTKSHAAGVNVDGLYLATAEYAVRGFRYARCAGVNGPVNATITNVSAHGKASA